MLRSLVLAILLVWLPKTLFAQESQSYAWDLTDLYPSEQAWAAEVEALNERIAGLEQYRGTLGESADSLLAAMSAISNVQKEVYRAYSYASLSRDTDQRDAEAQENFGLVRQMLTNAGEATSWVSPEVLSVGEDVVRSFLAQEPGLARFEFQLDAILRQAPHTLDEATEAILAQASLVLGSPSQIYQNYANADIPWPTITLSEGQEVTLNQSGYTLHRAAANREDRKKVFDTFWSTWEQFGDGMGATLTAEVQSNAFSARVRNHDGVLSQNLFDDGLPPEVYTQLVAQVNDALPSFHRYLKLRGRMLGVEDLRYYDIYPPLVEVNTGEFDIERSKMITLEAVRPFGSTYQNMLADSLAQQWMHTHPQPGKRSGAYMSGSAYDVHPYVLLNHNDDYESLSTFAHEWGHAMHSLLANESNPFETASYAIFIAEIAAITNEILVQEYMIANARTDEEKLYYLGSALESVRGTFFRQTMFAEFELAIHEAAEQGQPLTGPRLTEIYGELLKRYHGHDQGVLTIDELYTQEWAYIPHFYLDFYVFQYATSMTGAVWFAEKFLAGDDEVRESFLRVLRAGGSDYPHNILLNEGGLDMTQADAYQPVLRRMESLMDRIEALL